MFKNISTKIHKKPFLYGGTTLGVLILASIVLLGGGSAPQETMTITRGDFLSEVSASGKVIAAESSDLGFDQSGRISGVYVKVGDVVQVGTLLARIDNDSIRADIAQRQAALEREQAKLASLRRGTRPEQLTLTEQKYTDASVALTIAMRDAYLQIENALLSDVDFLFENGNSVNPDILIRTEDQAEERTIEGERVIVGEKMLLWKNALATLNSTSDAAKLSSVRTVSTDAMITARRFTDHLSRITGDLTTGNAGLSQTQIDSYRTTVNTAGQSISAAASTEQSSYAAWTVASNNLKLEKSGSTSEDIAAQEAQVKASAADLASSEAQLRKTLIVAPFGGTITKMNLKVGEIASPSVSEVAMIGTGLYEIESFIPEVNIARLAVSNPAVVTLDAYGSDVTFDASVLTIDPAETIRDGVSTYKTHLQFARDDVRIKPGMTANIRITTEKKSGVIVIPRSVIKEMDGAKTVEIMDGSITRTVIVETGSMTALGQVEIVSGLSEGDILVLPALSTVK